MKMDIWLFTLENLDCSKTDFLTEFNTGGDYLHAPDTEMRLQYGGSQTFQLHLFLALLYLVF